jgi:hypothetical protein
MTKSNITLSKHKRTASQLRQSSFIITLCGWDWLALTVVRLDGEGWDWLEVTQNQKFSST